jgi:hypothetical protein
MIRGVFRVRTNPNGFIMVVLRIILTKYQSEIMIFGSFLAPEIDHVPGFPSMVHPEMLTLGP